MNYFKYFDKEYTKVKERYNYLKAFRNIYPGNKTSLINYKGV